MGAPSAVDAAATCATPAQLETKTMAITRLPLMPIAMKLAHPRKPATADDLPNELYLLIFPLLSLPALATARNVCRRWRALVHASPLCPIRRRYLDIWVKAAAAATTPEAMSRRGSRDAAADAQSTAEGRTGQQKTYAQRWEEEEEEREAYIEQLERLAVHVPRELVLWVREWPRARGWLVPAHGMASSGGCNSSFWSGICGSGPGPGLEEAPTGHGAGSKEGAAYWGGWSVPTLLRGEGPYVKSVTFLGRGLPSASLLGAGTVLHATRILPAELAELPLVGVDLNFGFGEEEGEAVEVLEAARSEENTTIELMLLCLGEGRCYVLDGQGGGEELVGIVYSVYGSYTMQRDKIVARSWVDLVEKDLAMRTVRLSGKGASTSGAGSSSLQTQTA